LTYRVSGVDFVFPRNSRISYLEGYRANETLCQGSKQQERRRKNCLTHTGCENEKVLASQKDKRKKKGGSTCENASVWEKESRRVKQVC
jgi:hypothetical protein